MPPPQARAPRAGGRPSAGTRPGRPAGQRLGEPPRGLQVGADCALVQHGGLAGQAQAPEPESEPMEASEARDGAVGAQPAVPAGLRREQRSESQGRRDPREYLVRSFGHGEEPRRAPQAPVPRAAEPRLMEPRADRLVHQLASASVTADLRWLSTKQLPAPAPSRAQRRPSGGAQADLA